VSEKTLEQILTETDRESLQRIYEHYGTPEKWGKPWSLLVFGRCRAYRVSGIGGMELRAELDMGTKVCPISGKVCGEVETPHPADNVAGPLAALMFKDDKCPVCKKVGVGRDFYFR
jgi:hypothetical protein